MKPYSRPETLLLAGTLALFATACVLPAIAQDQAYHRFADARTLAGIPRAMDVLSNAGFFALGIWGLLLAWRRQLAFFSPMLKLSAKVFFAGFVITGLGSGYYHLSPGDAGLAWDRLGMVVAFAGVLGMVAAQRVSGRTSRWLLGTTLLGGPASVLWWSVTGSVTPYAVLQFGGMLMAALCLLVPARGVGPSWGLLLVAYTLAKLTETFDAQLFALTGELVSGHTLKHLLAALPALAVIVPLRVRPVVSPRRSTDNAGIN